jgi:molecular chaperone GrpE
MVKEVTVKEPSPGDSNGAEERRRREDHGHKRGGLKGRIHELESALERARAESEEHRDNWLRARADFENLKKRTLREVEQAHLRAGESLVSDLLPVVDDLEKAVEAASASAELRPLGEGLALILKRMREALRGRGVEPLDPAGEAFDPNLHEAVMQAPGEGAEPGTVMHVIQKGYLMNGRPLRHAKVVVAAGRGPKGGDRGAWDEYERSEEDSAEPGGRGSVDDRADGERDGSGGEGE